MMLSFLNELLTALHIVPSDQSKLPSEWNKHGPHSYTFQYTHPQSSLHFTVKGISLANKFIIHGVAIEVRAATQFFFFDSESVQCNTLYTNIASDIFRTKKRQHSKFIPKIIHRRRFIHTHHQRKSLWSTASYPAAV